MHPDRIATLPTVTVRLAALWVAAGALFKLFAGSPNDLPPLVQEFYLGKDLTFRLAIAIELLFVSTALLRPKWAWPWIAALYGVFLYVLLRFVLSIMATHEVSFLAAAFDSEQSCGCFGSKIQVAPGFMMAVDSLLLTLLLASAPWRHRLGELGPSWLPTGLAALSLLAPWLVIPPATGAVELRTDETGRAKVVGPRYVEVPLKNWVGQYVHDIPFAQSFFGDIDSWPGDATCVFYRLTCEHCARHIAELAEKDDGSRAYIFLRVPEAIDARQEPAVRVFPAGGHVIHHTLPEGTEYVLTTPSGFELAEYKVAAVDEHLGN